MYDTSNYCSAVIDVSEHEYIFSSFISSARDSFASYFCASQSLAAEGLRCTGTSAFIKLWLAAEQLQPTYCVAIRTTVYSLFHCLAVHFMQTWPFLYQSSSSIVMAGWVIFEKADKLFVTVSSYSVFVLLCCFGWLSCIIWAKNYSSCYSHDGNVWKAIPNVKSIFLFFRKGMFLFLCHVACAFFSAKLLILLGIRIL